MPRILPKHLSERDFTKAVDAFAAIVGKDWVFTSDDDRDGYLDPYSPGDPQIYSSSAAVAPKSVEEIQAVLRVANQYKVPLWTVSAGKNLAYGGAAPRLNGSVVMDLRRMNRILEVNEDMAYALVEPGVTFFDLYNHIKASGLKVWASVPAPGWGSVIGNTLERGRGYTPTAEHAAMQCGMEVVLADGSVVRTGMGAVSKSTAWQLFKYGFGPSLDGMFMQSNYGVVTKMGIWLMPEPEVFRPCQVAFQNESDLEPLVEALRPLRLDGTIQNNARIANPVLIAGVTSVRDEWYQGEGAMPDSVVQAIMKKMNLGRWNLSFALYGNEEMVAAREKAIRAVLDRIAGSRWSSRTFHRGDQINDLQAGVPSMFAFQNVNWLGGGAHIDFSPISPATGRDAMKQYEMFRRRYSEYGFDYYANFHVGVRELIHVSQIIFQKDDPEHMRKARELFELLVTEAGQQGYGEYRTHLAYMDLVARQYDFNDHALMRLNERIKDALDPNGILAPGKQGIWPKSMRENRG